MKLLNYLFACSLCISGSDALPGIQQEEFCALQNTTTQDGEEIVYAVSYSVAGLYVHAGTAIFNNKLEKINDTVVYHIIGDGKTNSSYDWIFKVRDTYQTYIDTVTMLPLYFDRHVEEGSYQKIEHVNFNHITNTAITKEGTYNVSPCIQDVLSAVYSARNIDFNRYKEGDKIPFRMFLDKQMYDLYIRYLGKENIKTLYGYFKAIKFKPLLVEGTLFKGGEKMTVWVSDDQNHIPVRIESPIIIGNVKVDMIDYKNLRYPLSGLKKRIK
jgi:hypothetical protein